MMIPIKPAAIPVPGLRQPVQLGDAVRRVTNALHIPHCSPCQKRQEALNRLIQLVPMRRNQ